MGALRQETVFVSSENLGHQQQLPKPNPWYHTGYERSRLSFCARSQQDCFLLSSHVNPTDGDVGSAIKLAAALPPFLSLHTTNGRLPTQTLVSETQGSLEKDLVCVPLVLDRIGGFITFGKPEGT